MYTISKQFTFEASHQLTGLREGHQCMRPHGHSYRVEVELSANLNSVGFVYDYNDLAPFKEFLDHELDHRHLNDLPIKFKLAPHQPTAELLAQWLYQMAEDVLKLPSAVRLRAVRVYETTKTCAEYRP